MLVTRSVVSILSVVMTIPGANAVFGRDFPNKPIRIITGGVGGSNDSASRLISSGVAGSLGQPVIIENRGATLLSAQALASSPPDGYSLLVAGDLVWLNPLLRGTPEAIPNFAPL